MRRGHTSIRLLATVILVGAAFQLACATLSPSTGTEEVSAAGVTLQPPPGWSFLDQGEQGLVLAANEADLIADQPVGGRITVNCPQVDIPDASEIEHLLTAPIEEAFGITAFSLFEEPAIIQVGEYEGVAIAFIEVERGIPYVRKTVTVNIGEGELICFALEAPSNVWANEAATMDAVLESAAFE